MKIAKQFLFIPLFILFIFSESALAKQSMQFADVFQFQYAKSTQLSEDGKFLAFSANPYRGDEVGHVYSLETNKQIAEIKNGTSPKINKSGDWVSFVIKPSLLKRESTTGKNKNKLKSGLAIVNTTSGEVFTYEQVKDYQVSDNGQWLVYRKDIKSKPEDKSNKSKSGVETSEKDKKDQIKLDKKDKSLSLHIVNLVSKNEIVIDDVLNYDLSHQANLLAFTQIFRDGENNNLSVIKLSEQASPEQSVLVMQEVGLSISKLDWHPKSSTLAFMAGNYKNDDLRRRKYVPFLFDLDSNKSTEIENTKVNWNSGKTAKLSWSENGERLYFENRPKLAEKVEKKKVKKTEDLYDFETIRQTTKLRLWHTKDPHIKPREEILWEKENKNKHYQAVYHLAQNKVVQLTTPEVPKLRLNKERTALLAYNSTPYLKKVNYDGSYADYYSVNVSTGKKSLIQKDALLTPSLSPKGSYASYFKNGEIFLVDLTSNEKHKIVTRSVQRFTDDKHDYPMQVYGYGIAGWMNDESAVLIYGKHDIWSFNTRTHQSTRLTNGELNDTRYRIKKLKHNQIGFDNNEVVYVTATNLTDKQTGISTLNLSSKEIQKVLTGDAKYSLYKKAKNSERIIFTQQDYHTFPDFWQTGDHFANTSRVTDLNPQVANFKWGRKPELISYKGFDGEDLQGVLIKPAGYKEGDKVPVVIYFYRYMTDRMFNFPRMELNHRPNFPMFTSNGYAIFLPDIRFKVGHPGMSSTQTMINAAQKLIDIGVADPKRIGLQGHSWAGYQSAFMITQTDMFKAVVSGAPVSNMTSAYGGIRLKSGKVRQFQYEKSQSRIGKTLFEGLDLYIENSPVFFADKVNTPILIMFGDKDDAVPWHEGVQYHLALERAGKDSIFLQYKGEPHHLKQFPNQLDFSIRMMEYFDHHLKGEPAPDWMIKGEAIGVLD